MRSISSSVVLGGTGDYLLHGWSSVVCLQKSLSQGLGNRLKVWGLAVVFVLALWEMLPQMCWSASLGVGRKEAWGKKKDKTKCFLGLFGMGLSLSESLEQQIKPPPLAGALCSCARQDEFCFNYLC